MSRFASVNEEGVDNLVDDKDAPTTKKATKQAWRVFLAYCQEKNIDLNIENINKVELNELLRKFYVEARKPDGGFYRKNSFNCIRHGLNRKIKEIHMDWDIVSDQEFQSSGIVFSAQCTSLKRKGLAKVEHYPAICEEDLRKLYNDSDVFRVDVPKNLQWKVFFELLLFFCRRAMENLRKLKKTTFSVKTAADGSRYIEKVVDELDKNHGLRNENEDGGVIKEMQDKFCAVKSFELYISKHNPKVDFLFQKPQKEAPPEGPWYDAQPIGVNTLAKFMKNISESAGLTKVYTNHSIRATITLLDGKGFEARHILTVSGHRSANSLRSYSRTSLATKQQISDTLSSCIRNESESTQNVIVDCQPSCSKNNTDTDENLPAKRFRPQMDNNDPRLSHKTFDLGVAFLESDEEDVNTVENLPESNIVDDVSCSGNVSTSINYSVNSAHGRPLVIRNNSNCVFNIKF